jgi:hypothetical protein
MVCGYQKQVDTAHGSLAGTNLGFARESRALESTPQDFEGTDFSLD